MNAKRISVIIPVYNVEQYLERCVTSVLRQTYTNLEIWLVDDGSTDGCPGLCDDFAKKDARVKVIHKENGGLSDARNVAIDACNGDFIFCLDSDDFIADDTIELLYTSLVTHDADIATCGFVNHYTEVPEVTKNNAELVLNTEAALENMLYQKDVTTSAWGKLYKRSLFEGVRYPKGKICEDLDTTYKLFSRSRTVVINTAIKLFYQQRTDSIINAQFSPKRMDALQFAKDLVRYIDRIHPRVGTAARNRLFMEAVFIGVQIPLDKKEFARERQRCADVIRANRTVVLLDTASKPIYRLYALLSFLGYRAMVRAYRLKSSIAKRIERTA
ncbi:glycosyltransferase family 2 protein [Streptomyces caniscabiei]|uniref:glycosyltransferase family 2 protein n=1 Tax=Streptomyces caniscabiei TaxID=2746961 RepID=UPI0029BA17C0|nr:glycosyltransferase family 2 protein [Streptomyces caniscabiei]MDX2776122.1 glycosyltransferase family 2 protein [Streptomyces caniscabiei]